MNRRQTIPKHLRYTVENFNQQFPNEDTCFVAIAERRFPNGMTHCEACQKETKHHRVSGRTAYACDRCGKHEYPLAGTIFEKTTTKLRLWLYAMYLMASTRCGISAKQIQRETGVTYKTAWRMFKQIRSLLAEELKLEGSSVEMDELYFGGRPRGKRRGPKWLETNKKSVVAGVVERKGKVIARVVEDASKKTLQGFAHQFILPESTVFTDEHPSYTGLDKTYTHHRIQHAAGVYVRVEKGLPIHTQCIEGFWSTVQNGIRGVYHSVSKKYLQTYLDEYSFRYNRRDSGNLIFHAIFDRAVQPSAAKPDPTDGKKTAEISVPF